LSKNKIKIKNKSFKGVRSSFGQNEKRARRSFGGVRSSFGQQSMLSMISRDSQGAMNSQFSENSQSNYSEQKAVRFHAYAEQDSEPEDGESPYAQGHQNKIQYDGDAEIEHYSPYKSLLSMPKTDQLDLKRAAMEVRDEDMSLHDNDVDVDLKDLETFDQNELDEENPNFDGADNRSEANDDEFRYDEYLAAQTAAYATPAQAESPTDPHNPREYEIQQILEKHQQFNMINKAKSKKKKMNFRSQIFR